MRKALITITLMAAAIAAPALAGERPAASAQGLWLNPHGTVAVRTGACGDRLCGWIVWANGEAQSDARDSGVDKLVGTELLEDYRPDGEGSWAGTVFIPDMNRRFSSRIATISPNQLQVKGCILGGLICKSQVWSRIEHLPQ